MESILRTKSFAYATRIVKLCRHLQLSKHEFTLSRQLLRSGTAVGALIHEAEFGQSRADFISKMSIALKEANESVYWLMLLKECKDIEDKLSESFISDGKELIAILVTTIKTTKKSEK